jgi:hypothetical protein
MGEYALPVVYPVPPPVAEPLPETHHLAVERPADPLDCGFLLSGGVLGVLPAKVRLPDPEDDDTA